MNDAHEAEVHLIALALRHPAGFDLGFAGIISIRSTDQKTIEVEWDEVNESALVVSETRSFPVENVEEAARFFVTTRHEMEYGLEYEHA